MEVSGKYNTRNSAVKRIMQEMKEMSQDTSKEYVAEALEDNIFEWHFAIHGPPETEFEGGIYHGRIVLPTEYPFKPPSFIMLTPNGRFETGAKICLSISSHHPEHWQPSWGVRTALTALIAFLPTPGKGAIGSLDYPKEERIQLAAKSRKEPPSIGNETRNALIKDLHERLLLREGQGENVSNRGENLVGGCGLGSRDSVTSMGHSQEEEQCTTINNPGLPIQNVSSVASHLDGNTQYWQPSWMRPALSDRPQQVVWEERILTGIAGAICMLIAAILLKKIFVNFGFSLTAHPLS